VVLYETGDVRSVTVNQIDCVTAVARGQQGWMRQLSPAGDVPWIMCQLRMVACRRT
jgi:hypothetical protein